MKNLHFWLGMLALIVPSPAFADKYFAVTPSGATEMLFPDAPTVVIGQLSSKCIDAHWTVTTSNSTEVVCEAPLNMGQSILGQMLMGNSYSTPPRRFFRFNIASVNGVSRVQASGWMELQMAFGQIKRTDFSGPEFHNNIMNFMSAAGGRFPLGTTFPNHVVMGVKSADVAQGGFVGLRITEVEPGSAAAKAGLQVGDIVTRIAHKQFKNAGGFLDALAKAAESPSYEVEISRDGKPVKFSLDRVFRPAFAEPVTPRVEDAAAQSLHGTPLATLSVADELGKLARLKEQGLLTQAEFDEQKRKLLGK